ncbi:CLUMA_CG005322, isoform A [Clunio marinus]|uniref:CLUMA_CG005322, isoform A n=1 Tax=Clunio marinus TaxID=568069 RepID=A0A1J1HZW3_9DIPT|nr:CLUMA_CG005322, isoform A [Clunio marinus]
MEISSKDEEQSVVVVHIEEGIHFNSAPAIYIQATLSGNKLNAEPVKPGHTTLIDCNLVWETDKKSVKRMKSDNLSIKIECFALSDLKTKPNETRKELIGYILVPMKVIPVVPIAKAIQTKPRWTRVIGLSKEWRQFKPELLLNTMITSKEFLTYNKNEALEARGLEIIESMVIEENPTPGMLTSQKGIFIRLLQEEGLLQVGHIDTECDVFTIKILLKHIRDLDLLLNESQSELSNDLFINYVLLGNPHTRALDKKFNRQHQIHEKVSINFRSSLALLKEYFDKVFFIPFDVVAGDKILGKSEIKLNQLITTTSLREFFEKYPTVSCEFDGTCVIKNHNEDSSNHASPVLDYQVSIHYIATKKLHQTELLENFKRSQRIDSQAGGDNAVPSHRDVLTNIKSSSRQKETLNDYEAVKSVGVGQSEVIKKPSTSHSSNSVLNAQKKEKSSELPRIYSCTLHISTIKFNRKPCKGIWQVLFFHDKADTQKTFVNKEINEASDLSDNTFDFDEVELKLFFKSEASNIMELIKSSDNCCLTIKGPKGAFGKAHLDCTSLLIGNKENKSGMIIFLDSVENVMAMANIYVTMNDLGINFNSIPRPITPNSTKDVIETRYSDMNVTKTFEDQKMRMLDEDLTYKLIDELEEWKSNHQKQFMLDLKQKETQLLEVLKTEWLTKQTKLEQEILVKAEEMKSLTNALKDAQKDLKDNNSRMSRDDQDLETYKRELEATYKNQLIIIRERARELETDLMHELKLKDIQLNDLNHCNQHLKTENCELRHRLECLQSEFAELKANVMPPEQVEKLIQEIEQWAKAVRESHIVRRQQIRNEKENLFDAKFESLYGNLDDDNCELNIDKHELEQIKQCLNVSDDEI